MAVYLQTGQTFPVTETSRVLVGLSWEAERLYADISLFRRLFERHTNPDQQIQKEEIDGDAFAFLLHADDRILSRQDMIFYNHLKHRSGAVRHLGENLLEDFGAHNAQIIVDLAALPTCYQRIVFIVSIYQSERRGQHFGMMHHPAVELIDANSGMSLCGCCFEGNYDGMMSLLYGELARGDGGWTFTPVGQPFREGPIADLAARYGFRHEQWQL